MMRSKFDNKQTALHIDRINYLTFALTSSVFFVIFTFISFIRAMEENEDGVAEYPSSDDERDKVESFMSNERRSRQIEEF